MHNIEYIKQIILQHFQNPNCTESDDNDLDRLIEQYPQLKTLIEEFKNKDQSAKHLTRYNHISELNKELVYDRILDQLEISTPKKSFKIHRIIGYAAACIILLCSIGYLTKNYYETKVDNIELAASNIKAGEKGAIIRLSDGSTVELSSLQDGIVTGEDVTYEDGSKIFDEKDLKNNQKITLVIPNGKEFQITLADGTKVWLNAGSELSYPIKFNGNKRIVNLKGEAYFEVAKNPSKPFVVESNKQTIEVLGTHFNINDYEGGESQVTLIEGKVQVESDKKSNKILTPGQQSSVKNGKMSIRNVDVNEYIAWKNGEFTFNDEGLDKAMDKIKRWYDLDIEVKESAKNIHLWGSIQRTSSFADVLKLIKLTNKNLKIDIDGKKVTVSI